MNPISTNKVNTPAGMVTPIQPITDDLGLREPIPDRPVRVLAASFPSNDIASAAIEELRGSGKHEGIPIDVTQRDRDLDGGILVTLRTWDTAHAIEVLRRHGGVLRSNEPEAEAM
jgi:hypothetical protein